MQTAIAQEFGVSITMILEWKREFGLTNFKHQSGEEIKADELNAGFSGQNGQVSFSQTQKPVNFDDNHLSPNSSSISQPISSDSSLHNELQEKLNVSAALDQSNFIGGRYPKRNCSQRVKDKTDQEPNTEQPTSSSILYPIDEYISANEFVHDDTIHAMKTSEFTMEYIKKSGLLHPLLFNEPPEELGMRMPNPQEFSILDVLELVGGERRIEVFDVHSQQGKNMRLKEFVNYFIESPSCRENLLNSLSLEISDTKLSEQVIAPGFVRRIDWIDNVWPKELLARQKNLLKKSRWARSNDFSTYPKVQKYCLMSVANCFTDFHIDFGGSSVWYHILKGEKIFWLIEPTEENLKLYEEWFLARNEDSKFLGKLTKCSRVRLRQGETLIIPSGWIHSVYTPVDSLVFGGNFLHSYAIPKQIRISILEDNIKRGKKYRFPHFKQIFWCFIAQIVRKCTHRLYHKKLSEEAHNVEGLNLVQVIDERMGDQMENNGLRHNSEGEEICYDEFLGNSIDGSYTFNPIQSVYDNKDTAKFTPTKNYNIGEVTVFLKYGNETGGGDYLRSLPPLVISGLPPLLNYAKQLLRLKRPEVIEGITRPHHLVKEFQALIEKMRQLGLCDDK
ncbi:hypothetical protein niasHT_022111 [Heterodera trifolii]|uniref:JmjC domain-containing protein n=1 Tax=Heterodera trifolii TaxID=157864 RepID=A0ABD2K9J4_9BILA